MKPLSRTMFLALWALLSPTLSPCLLAQSPSFTRQEDIIYGRKHGTALTLDKFTPTGKSNGRAAILVVSGGWFSSHDGVNGLAPIADVLCKRGYTCLAVVHGSQPRFTIPEAIEDLHLATRFIRSKAKVWNIDPDKLAITGASAGGHLSLMMGVQHKPGDPKNGDPVLRQPSGVQAVACFFPPTDFLEWGRPGVMQLGRGKSAIPGITAPFRFVEFKEGVREFHDVTDEKKLEKIGKEISPIHNINKDSAPSLLLHGDKDILVPLEQAERFVAAMNKASRPAKLDFRKGAGHGWKDMPKDAELFADWWEEHLGKPEAK